MHDYITAEKISEGNGTYGKWQISVCLPQLAIGNRPTEVSLT
jgi:hypothetical protein